MRADGLRAVLRERRFRRLVTSQWTSQAADGLYQIALAAVLIFDVSTAETPAQVTKVLAATLLPFSVIGPFTGPFIDRFSRRSILVGSSVLRVALTLLLLIALDWPEPALLALIVANVSVNRFFHATKSAVIPATVRPDRYLLANTVSSVGGMVFGLAGAVVGGPMADLLSVRVVILTAAVLMAMSALAAATIDLPEGEKRGLAGILSELRQNARDVAEGLRALRARPPATYAVTAVWTIRGLLGFLLLAGLVLVRARLELAVTGFSALLASVAVGGFVGALLVAPVARRLGTSGVAPPAYVLAALATLVVAPLPSIPTVLASLFVGGLAMSSTKIASDTMIQRALPDRFRGRAFAVYDIGYNGVFVLAALIPTLLVPLFGEVGIVIAAGAMGLAAAGVLARWRARLDQEIEVRAYAGGRADETPREVVIEGAALEVADVERSWNEERGGERLIVFVLRLEDGRRIQVSRDETWHLDRFLEEG